MNEKKEDNVTLSILEAIENKNDMTQRHLADNLGVALGLANSYLKRCVKKGLVKIHQAPANRYLYYLTPKGFSEKSRLTTQYLSTSFEFYRRAGDSCKEIFIQCDEDNLKKILLICSNPISNSPVQITIMLYHCCLKLISKNLTKIHIFHNHISKLP